MLKSNKKKIVGWVKKFKWVYGNEENAVKGVEKGILVVILAIALITKNRCKH
jgi:hypothetical protein